ncbi:MAG: DNA repair protein RadC [Nitrosopumilales archaeon]|nr:MAG: DNA repair protein RadC [Nitrosopumilales archaeon]
MKQLLKLREPQDHVRTPEDLFKNIQKVNIEYEKENLILITLNTKNQIINSYIISIGTLDASLVHPREVFRHAIIDCAHSVIIAHNHPSGDVTPSNCDKEVTQLLIKASDIIGIVLLDHIIFNKREFISMGMLGLMRLNNEVKP